MFCKFCSGSTLKLFPNGIECQACHTVQVIEVPSDSTINEYYLNFNVNYTGGGAKKNQIKYAKSYKDLIFKFKNKFSTLLDIGCSNSPFPNLFDDTIKVSVLDLVKPENLKSKINFYKGLLDHNFPEIPFKYDVITAWAVIEHVKDVRLSFEKISNLLNKDGYFFLTTPEIGTFLSIWNPGKTPWFFPPEHLHILSARCLINIAEQFDLELVEKGHFEITKLRFIVRYYMFGFIETIVGLLLYFFSKRFFQKIKMKRYSSFKGIQYLVFRKR